jgi:two-component system response regulator PilR (NtrC family)
MQVKLLRAIQERAVRPVGAQAEEPVDVRILSATHKDLGPLVQEGVFRQDLYYRINVIELHVPALRERPEDIAPLADHVLAQLAARTGMAAPALSPEASASLAAYAFPGNVRELENLLERALTLAEGDVIRPEDMQLPEPAGGAATAAAPATPPRDALADAARESAADLDAQLVELERQRILDALEAAGGNKTAAARQLGLGFGAFRYRLQKLGLD